MPSGVNSTLAHIMLLLIGLQSYQALYPFGLIAAQIPALLIPGTTRMRNTVLSVLKIASCNSLDAPFATSL